jgi:hypothetical protein
MAYENLVGESTANSRRTDRFKNGTQARSHGQWGGPEGREGFGPVSYIWLAHFQPNRGLVPGSVHHLEHAAMYRTEHTRPRPMRSPRDTWGTGDDAVGERAGAYRPARVERSVRAPDGLLTRQDQKGSGMLQAMTGHGHIAVEGGIDDARSARLPRHPSLAVGGHF